MSFPTLRITSIQHLVEDRNRLGRKESRTVTKRVVRGSFGRRTLRDRVPDRGPLGWMFFEGMFLKIGS